MRREYQIAAIMAISAFFTLAGYEFIRSSSTVLFKEAYGAENLPLVMAAIPFVVFLGVALYGHILTLVGPAKTLLITSLGSSLLIAVCYLLIRLGVKEITPVLYLLKEFYIVLLIEQYWSFINSHLKSDTARKVNGPITGISGLGAGVGGWLVSYTAEPLGTETMILMAAIFILPAAVVSSYAYRRFGEPEHEHQAATGDMGWRLFRENPVLAYLLAIVISTQIVAATLDFKFQEILSLEFAGDRDKETAFQGWFFGTLSVSSLVLQFVIAPLLLSFFKLRWIHILMPVVHVTTITFAIIEPSLLSVGIAFFLFKSMDYSLFRAAKEILYIPFSFDVRYRAKEVIDVFGYRSGKGGSSVIIAILQRGGVVMGNYYLAIAYAATIVWLFLIFPLTHHFSEQEKDR
ncbi:MAG: hypothetical protein OEZ23_09955 [Gammaproteobacteria bacterium]|nr:hypothetical protein [Gammaproteobacteria bacterium]